MPDDDSDFSGPFRMADGKISAFDPDTKKYLPVNDVREEWKAESEEFPTTKEQREAFFQQRIRLVESSNISENQKQELLETLNQSLKEQQANDSEVPPEPMPLPGGVGYGAFYKDGSLEFQNLSVLYFKIITDLAVGNAANKWLYLTSTNRAPKGVEAYISYHLEEHPTFNIFDWSKTGNAQFAVSKPYTWLDDYLVTRSEAGKQYQTLYVINSTRRVNGQQWINEVMVYNSSSNAYDLVYSNQYTLDPFDEKKYLWWGPIVETFPPFPFTINDVGFFDAQLVQDAAPATLLTNAVTDLKTDHAGAQVVFERPNYSFVVHW